MENYDPDHSQREQDIAAAVIGTMIAIALTCIVLVVKAFWL